MRIILQCHTDFGIDHLFVCHITIGSSTACILSLCKLTGTLKASNLGDSAFLLIRDNQCIYESPSQQHFWNCPYQLTVLPPKLRQQQQRRESGSGSRQSTHNDSSGDSGQDAPQGGGKDTTGTTLKTRSAIESAKAKSKKKAASYVQDSPQDAMQSTHQLQDGDVIVLATDGFWDNVFTKEAIELVERELGDIIRQQQQHREQQVIRPLGEAAEGNPTMIHDGGSAIDHSERTMAPEMTADEILARVRALSKRLTNTARRFSLDTKRMTPFSQGARHLRCGG